MKEEFEDALEQSDRSLIEILSRIFLGGLRKIGVTAGTRTEY
jgi:hypothetical protein